MDWFRRSNIRSYLVLTGAGFCVSGHVARSGQPNLAYLDCPVITLRVFTLITLFAARFLAPLVLILVVTFVTADDLPAGLDLGDLFLDGRTSSLGLGLGSVEQFDLRRTRQTHAGGVFFRWQL
jgi:hypothetical protein